MTIDAHFHFAGSGPLCVSHFVLKQLVVRLTQSEESDRFAQLGAISFEPATAMVSLLDHFVRMPAATGLSLDCNAYQQVIDVQLLNPSGTSQLTPDDNRDQQSFVQRTP
jgi:hypothetical protein